MTATFRDGPCPIFKNYRIGFKWNFKGKIECPSIVDFGSDVDELVYFRVKSSGTSGDLEGIRGRVESDATSTGMNINALHGDAVVNASKKISTARGLYTDAMVKDSAECTTVRGGEFNVSIYNGATITNSEGVRVNVLHPSAAVSVSGVDTILHLVIDGSNNHAAKSGIDVDTDTGTSLNGLIDSSGATLTPYNTNEVVLMKFKDSGGTTRYLVFDVDAATSVKVTDTIS